MKNRLPIITIILLSVISTVASTSADMSDWAESEIKPALDMGFVPHKIQENYKNNITRAEFAELAVSYLAVLYNTNTDGVVKIYCDTHITGTGENVSLAKNVFTDCDDMENLYAYTMGIVKGREEGIFDPDGLITREEAAAMIMRTLFVYGGGLKHGRRVAEEFALYSDYSEISAWALSYVEYVWELDIMKGVSETEFSPKTSCSREQAIAIFLRLFNNYWIKPSQIKKQIE